MLVTADYSNAEYFVCEACGMKCLSSPGLKRHKRKCETHRLRLGKYSFVWLVLYGWFRLLTGYVNNFRIE